MYVTQEAGKSSVPRSAFSVALFLLHEPMSSPGCFGLLIEKPAGWRAFSRTTPDGFRLGGGGRLSKRNWGWGRYGGHEGREAGRERLGFRSCSTSSVTLLKAGSSAWRDVLFVTSVCRRYVHRLASSPARLQIEPVLILSVLISLDFCDPLAMARKWQIARAANPEATTRIVVWITRWWKRLRDLIQGSRV